MPTLENINNSVAEPVDVTVRERLLMAALTIFNAKGYAAASVREIVAAAGVTKPALYYYFKNKKGIYVELVSRAQELFQKAIFQNTPSQKTSRNQLKLFALRIFDSVIENKAVAYFGITSTFGPSHHSNVPNCIITLYDTAVVEIIQRLVKQGIDRKEFQSINVELVAWLYASYITKAVLEQVSLSPQRKRREELISILDGFLDSLQMITVNAQ